MLDYESTRIGNEEYVCVDGMWIPRKLYEGIDIIAVDYSSSYPGAMINEEV